jgi:hypothetical protein
LEITKKTVLSLLLVVITLTTLTTTIAAYAGGDDNNDDNGDGNKQKAEDDSAAAIADCDDNDVELARFLCIALATNDIEIETEPPSEEPPEEEGSLAVCKVVEDPSQEVDPNDFALIVTDRGGSVATVTGTSPPACEDDDLSLIPGEYEVTEEVITDAPDPDSIEVEGDCVQDPTNPLRATGEIQEGETQTCTFINTYEDGGNS